LKTKKFKILSVIRQGEFGGGETYLYNLVSNLDKENFENVVLSFSEGNMVKMLNEIGIKTIVIDTQSPFNVLKYRRVINLIKNENPDIIHLHGTRACSNALIPAKICKKNIIYTVHGWSFHSGDNFVIGELKKNIEKFFIKNSDVTICGSNNNIELGKSLSGKSKFKLVRNSIDTEKFKPTEVNHILKKEFGFKNDDVIIGFAARLTYQKDPLTFIRALPFIFNHSDKIKALIIGEGELQIDCINLVSKLNIKEKVIFSGFRADVSNVLSVLDVFVLPSLWEVVPLGLLEAMSMEIPCVATNIPGTDEVMIHLKNGMTFSTGDYKMLSFNIVQLLSNRELKESLKINARKIVKEKFDLKRLIQEYTDLFSTCKKQLET